MAGPWEEYTPATNRAVSPTAPLVPPVAATDIPAPGTMMGPWQQYAQPRTWGDTALGAAKAVGSGLTTGAIHLGSLPGDTGELLGAAAGGITGLVAPYETQKKVHDAVAGTLQLNNPVTGRPTLPTYDQGLGAVNTITGFTPYKPQTPLEEYLGTVASFAPGTLAMGPKTLSEALLNAGKFAVGPGVTSELGGQMTKGSAAEPYARVAGALLGASTVNSLSRPKMPKAPSIEDLKAKSQELYRDPIARSMVIDTKTWDEGIDRIVGNVLHDPEGGIVDPTIHSNTYAALQRFEKAKGIAPTLQEMENLRKLALDASQNFDPVTGKMTADGRFGAMLVREFDKWSKDLTPADAISGGDPKAAFGTLQEARRLWAIKSKAQVVDNVFERALNKVGANYTKAGLQTAIRQEFRAIASSPIRLNQFDEKEQFLIKQIVRGLSDTGNPMSWENTLRQVGKLAPAGSWLSMVGLPTSGASVG